MNRTFGLSSRRGPDAGARLAAPGGLQTHSTVSECSAPSNGISPAIPPPVLAALAGRCAEKGCVFPAAPGGNGRCLNHRRELDEPALYGSRQPSSAMVARGKYGPASAEDIREATQLAGRDRRRLIAERESFLGE